MNHPRIAVIGAGLVGVGTALELARQGAQVTLFEAQRGLACGGSFQPGGLLSAAITAQWVAQGIARPGFSRSRQLPRAGWRRTFSDWQWLRHHWKWQSHASLATRQRAMAELARLSQMHLSQLGQMLDADLETTQGVHWINDRADGAASPGLVTQLAEWGMTAQVRDTDALAAAEPGLDTQARPLQATWLPGDLCGNPRLTAQLMREAAERLGASFHFGAQLKWLERKAEGWQLHMTAQDDMGKTSTAFAPTQPAWDAHGDQQTFDHVVLCTQRFLPEWLKHPLAQQFRQLRAYSISAPIRDYDRAPRHGLFCERRQMSVARLGHRIRAAGAMRLEPRDQAHDPASDQRVFDQLYASLDALLPGVAQTKQAQQWTGVVSLLPDGLPAIGQLETGLWVNMGHGMSGWSTGAGSARLLADKLLGRLPADAASAFDPLRSFQPGR